MFPRLVSIALAALVVLAAAEALAFELLPISREFTPAGSGATQSYEVINTGKEPVAINVTVVTRVLDSTGAESNKSAEDDFLIYPPQFVVQPGDRQSIRVSWLGNPAPAHELAYRLVVEQLPIERFKAKPTNGAPAGGAITVLRRYMGSLYVRPVKAVAKLAVESVKLERGAPGKEPQLAVMVHNRGTGRAVLKNTSLEVKARGDQPPVSVPFTTFKLKASVVLPDGRLLVHLPWPQGVEPEVVTVRARPGN